MFIHKDQAKPFLDFIQARHEVYLNRRDGKRPPWTRDPILAQYRFCNVYRELDAVTMWIRQNWSHGLKDNPDVWFAMVVARLVNRTSTLEQISPLPWDKGGATSFERTIDTIMAEGGQAFSAAYIVSTNGQPGRKSVYLKDMVLTPMWEARRALRPKWTAALDECETLEMYHTRLMQWQGMGSFMAAQVVADLKHTRGTYGLRGASDWWTWAAPGPGSWRGLNRVRGRGPVRTGYRGDEWLRGVLRLQDYASAMTARRGWPSLCAQDIQNCLCEFDKYERARLGEGTPKQRYSQFAAMDRKLL